MPDPRVLLFDIESSPNLSWTWGKWDQNVLRFEREWYILAISWTWLGERQVNVKGLDDYDLYATEPHNDIELARLARALLDEADVVVGHNSTAFDVKKCQARMVYHQLDPPSSFKEVDTLKQARRHFAFNGNSLDDLTRHLGIGAKGHPGLNSWFRCIEGEPGAWKRMKAYCRQDVKLLEKLALRLCRT